MPIAKEIAMFDDLSKTPAGELAARIARLQQELAAQGLDGALILQNSDLFYFSGTIQQANLYVPAKGDPLLAARKSFRRARAESALENVVPLASPKKLPQIIQENGLPLPRRIGLELDVLPVNIFRQYEQIFPDAKFADISTTIRMIRAVKSDYEIGIIRQAAARADQVAGYAAKTLKPGMTELEAAGLVEAHARKLGHQGIIRMRLWGSELFYGHLLAGPSGAVPSYFASPTGGQAANPAVAQGAGFALIEPDQPVVLDYVFAYQGYLADHTRIFCPGRLPAELEKAHEAILKIQSRLKQEIRTGAVAGDIYDLALRLAADAGLEDNFMGVGPRRIRFVGHGVGLELDEFPFLAKGQKLVLEDNMVIALEPKLIFPGKGVVGIENTHLVTKDGLEQLTNFAEQIFYIND